MSLTQIVDVTISANTTAVSQAGFGTPLFCFSAGNKSTDTVDFEQSGVSGEGAGDAIPRTKRTFVVTSLSEVLATGILTSDPAYLGASAFFAQTPQVSKLVLCKYWNEDTLGSDADSSYGDAIVKAHDENTDWYAILSDATSVIPASTPSTDTDRDDAVMSIATMATGLGNGKLYFVGDTEAPNYTSAWGGTATAGDICGKMRELNSDRIITFYHHLPYAECAFAGHNLPYSAGQATWSFLSLNGFGASQVSGGGSLLNASQKGNLLSNADSNGGRMANFIEQVAGQAVTREGRAVSGEFIDIVRGIDALDEAMTKALFSLIINQKGKKLPFTNAGTSLVASVMDNVLTGFVASGFIEPQYQVSVPNANSVPSNTKALRRLEGCKFTAFLQGAIHFIELNGEVTFPT